MPNGESFEPVECADCVFWIALQQTDSTRRIGECHRRAPRPGYEPEPPAFEPMAADVRWPVVSHEDFCGDGVMRPDVARSDAKYLRRTGGTS